MLCVKSVLPGIAQKKTTKKWPKSPGFQTHPSIRNYMKIPFIKRKVLIWKTCVYIVYFPLWNFKTHDILICLNIAKNDMFCLTYLVAFVVLQLKLYEKIPFNKRKLLVCRTSLVCVHLHPFKFIIHQYAK